MFKKLFSTLKEEVQNTLGPVIDSAHIQNDLHQTFGEVLAEFGLKESKESEIDSLEAKLEKFKSENVEVFDKIQKLKSAGFINTPSVKRNLKAMKDKESKILSDISTIENEIKSSKRIKDLHSNYLLEYPGFKFIDFKSMVSIMKKYDLFMGETFMYAREIPDRALNLIGRFMGVIEKSKVGYVLIKTESRSHSWFKLKKGQKSPYKYLGDEPFKDRVPVKESEYYPTYLHSKESIAKVFELSCLQIVAPLSHFDFPVQKMKDVDGEKRKVPLVQIDSETNMISLCMDKANKIQQEIREVLDPIACIKVDGGFIIIDAWDKEAEIPEIKNPMNN